VKIHCSVLAEDAIKAAVSDWKQRKADTREGEKKAV
jgi:NifU-like protein involved in Fe-S cluster formation